MRSHNGQKLTLDMLENFQQTLGLNITEPEADLLVISNLPFNFAVSNSQL